MTTVETGVVVLRVVATTLAMWNLTWTFYGALRLLHGHFNPPEVYLSAVFFMAITVLVFQISYMLGGPDSWKLLAYALLSGTMMLAAIGHALGASLKARQFYSMYDHLGVAMAIVDLAKVNAKEAERQAAECRRLTALSVI